MVKYKNNKTSKFLQTRMKLMDVCSYYSQITILYLDENY